MGYTVDAGGQRVRRSEAEIARMRAKLGMVFQGFNLFPHMSALKNVALGPMRVLGTPPAQAAEQATAMLERVGLADKADEMPGRLSGGQQQRVAIARALAMKPKAMLFDEVTSALDPELVAEVLDVMRQLVQEGMTMVIVTHEMAFARAFAHRALFMAEGEIVEQGEPAALFGDPQSMRLQAFLKRFKEGYQL
jgi:ABC-type polar amino acid transport system ATPase subunit